MASTRPLPGLSAARIPVTGPSVGRRAHRPFVVVSESSSSAYGAVSSPTVSVIVSTRDRAHFLGGLFEALESQTVPNQDFEVIVVDDGSRDGTWDCLVKVVQESELRLLILRIDQSVGQGTGRNVGLERARSSVISFVDDDCIPASHWLESLSSEFLRGGHEPPGLVVQGRTVPWPRDSERAGPWARTLWVLSPTWLFETCNIAYRRVDIERVGGMPGSDEVPSDPSGKLVGEDALLGWRVIESGAQLLFRPDAVVYHRRHPASYLDWVKDRCGVAVFPRLMRRSPLARNALWARWFLARRTAAFDLALVSGVLAVITHQPRWLVGAVPWISIARTDARYRGGRHPAVRLAQLAVGDAVGFVSLVVGSVRSRSIVL